MSHDQENDRVKISVVEDPTDIPTPIETTPPTKPEPALVTPLPALEPESDKLPFWMIFLTLVIGILLGAGLVGGFFYYQSHIGATQNPTPQPTLQTTPTPLPSVTPQAVVEKEVKISVLNGSGKKGEASKVEGLLKNAGFSQITTGNAKSYDYTKTLISYSQETDQVTINALKTALKNYVLELKPVSTSNGIEIIVGSSTQ